MTSSDQSYDDEVTEPPQAETAQTAASPTEEAPGEQFPYEEILADAQEDALDFLEGLLEVMGVEGEVEVVISEGGLEASVTGDDLGLLIGRQGRTLEATQELLRTAVQRGARTRVRVNLDIEGYRHRRKEALVELARDRAQEALETGEVELEPMSAYERKVVHDAVGEIEGVSSFSEGEEPDRRVVIRAD
jgi:spoIIIJ-associated protein